MYGRPRDISGIVESLGEAYTADPRGMHPIEIWWLESLKFIPTSFQGRIELYPCYLLITITAQLGISAIPVLEFNRLISSSPIEIL